MTKNLNTWTPQLLIWIHPPLKVVPNNGQSVGSGCIDKKVTEYFQFIQTLHVI